MSTQPLITVHHPHAGPDAPFYTLKLVNDGCEEPQFLIQERDNKGYCGHAGNFYATPENWPKAIEYLLGLADMNPQTPPPLTKP